MESETQRRTPEMQRGQSVGIAATLSEYMNVLVNLVIYKKWLLLRRCIHLLEHDLLALEQRAAQELTDRIANVRTGNDRDGPLLPLAVPNRVSMSSSISAAAGAELTSPEGSVQRPAMRPAQYQ